MVQDQSTRGLEVTADKTAEPEGKQMLLHLSPQNPYALSYFVRHSGVAEGAAALERAVEQLVADPQAFSMIVLFGPHGSGKRHLTEGYIDYGIGLGAAKEKIATVAFEKNPDDQTIERFVSDYERLRSAGGVIICRMAEHPEMLSSNPHLRSRLLAGQMFKTGLPDESEIGPIVKSLAEKHNLNLSEKSISLIIEYLPRDTLSFETILAKISELCFAHGKSAKISVVRDAVSGRMSRPIE